MKEHPPFNPEKSHPAPRRESPDHPVESEQPVNRERVHELARELEVAEREMQGEVHDAMADFLTKLGRGKLARWVSRGALLATLFTAETAMAEEASNQQAIIETESQRREIGRTLLLQTPFRKLIERGGDMTVTGVSGSLYDSRQDWQKELLEKGKAHLPSSQIRLHINFVLNLEEAKRLFEHVGEEKLTQIAGGVLDSVRSEFTDKNGNTGSYFLYWGEGGDIRVNAHTSTQYFFARDKIKEPSPVPVSFDLSVLGLESYDHLFTMESVPYVDQVGDYEVFRDGIDRERAEDTIARFGTPLRQGLERVSLLFAGNIRKPRLLLTRGFRQNAGMNSQDALLHLTEQLFDPVDSQVHLESYKIDEIAAHEMFHLASNDWALASDSRWSDLFRKTSEAIIVSVNEEEFSGGEYFGGHADESEGEFFASFANSLDHPDWDLHIANKTADERLFYAKALKTLQAILSERMKEKNVARLPLADMIAQRLDAMRGFDEIKKQP